MKRRPILISGIFLSIIYALGVVGTIALGIAGVIYYFMGETIQIIKDLFVPLLKPFISMGNIYMLVFIGLIIIAAIFMVVVATRFMKYSGATKEQFAKKKGLLIFNDICVLIATAGYSYWLASNLLASAFTTKLVVNIVLCSLIFIHFLSAILIIVGIAKEKAPIVDTPIQTQQGQETPTVATTLETRPAIYTAGLDIEYKVEDVQKEKETKKQESKVVENVSSQKLIEGIAKLDQMRKEGAISAQEYTRLRGQMIKKFVK